MIVVGVTGASGIIYAEKFLSILDEILECEVGVVLSKYASVVANEELARPLRIPPRARVFSYEELMAPFASGSNPPDGMVIIPCTMGTIARIANGIADNLIVRAADVVLKEKRPLIVVPREIPLNRIHLENMLALLDAGATIIPACPSFYHHPSTIDELILSVIARVLDHLHLPHNLKIRWKPAIGELE